MNYEQQKYFKRITGFELLLDPQTAYDRGVVPALVMQQLQNWITTSTAKYEDALWVNPTQEDWASELPYIPYRKIRSALAKLVKEGVVEERTLRNDDDGDISTFYLYPSRKK